ncbi:GntR family transcriptional regulator [Marinisporobacter balticus]|uniref:DNA-binding GntR family transcriptional regulator n=1 Tax=Marinisporobacter balticus TaxID=2018667 RepID=A0A4R2KYK9_9FIRM|nr:GntR family transcriptional regulator [Marinisporobacter balticus]TCO76499.1 DNA-binding GntR family transcriptional regulator [Marinisporobacter balticus]
MNRIKIDELPLKEKAYRLIKDKLIKCELMPGMDISEEQLSKEIGSSRTPVREALLRLEQEKLVNIYPRKGIIVSYITIKDIYEVFQIREMIEIQSAKIVCKSIAREKLMEFQARFDKLGIEGNLISEKEFYDLDIEFHKYIVDSTNNNRLIEFMNKIYDQDYRIRVMTTRSDEQERKRNRPEHLGIINALLEKNEDTLEKKIRKHIENARSAALKIVY